MTTGRRRGWPGYWSATPSTRAQSRGWDTLSNGALLSVAEEAGYEVLLTTDRRIRYQQNLKVRRIALVVLTGTTKWTHVRQRVSRIVVAVETSTAGSYSEVEIPFEPTSASR